MATLGAPNITAGQGGRTANYTDDDWLRTLRHGVGKDGKGLWIMPSHEFYLLGDGDIGKLIAYLKTVPAVNRSADAHTLGLLGRVLVSIGQVQLIPAERIPHDQKPPAPPAVGATADYGHYMATTCSGCHNANYSGGAGPGDAPGAPIPANLTQIVRGYKEQQFIDFLRTGKTLAGREIPNEVMPWRILGPNMTDTELKALYAYFVSLPPRETGK